MNIDNIIKKIDILEKKVELLESKLKSTKLADSRNEKWNEFQSIVRLQQKNKNRKAYN